MKFNVLGCSQQKAVELGLDLTDLALLDWLRDFVMSDKIKCIRRGGKKLFWVDYKTLLEDMPVLGIRKQALRNRLRHLEDLGILVHSYENKTGALSYYGFGEKAKDLYYHSYSNTQGVRNEIRRGMQPNTQGVRNEIPTINPLTNNPSTIPSHDNMRKKEEEKKLTQFPSFEQRRARYEQ